MGNRAECPVCKSYSSDVYRALHYDYSPCPRCQAPHEVLTKWANLSEELEELQTKRINKDLIEQIKEINAENAALKTKLARLEKVLGYDETVVKPILDAIKILNNEEVEDE
jgi:DNA repair exonuclease SbcCD ATPase subunit